MVAVAVAAGGGTGARRVGVFVLGACIWMGLRCDASGAASGQAPASGRKEGNAAAALAAWVAVTAAYSAEADDGM